MSGDRIQQEIDWNGFISILHNVYSIILYWTFYKMEKKSKRRKKTNKKGIMESVLNTRDFRPILAHEKELVAYAEIDLSMRGSTSRCFGKLALAHTHSEDDGRYP